ncbi:glycosyltransferase family 4 protein [Rhodophyticola porphyridii]|uniref:Glycosyltransferase family 1 protein n=1 Tax=Rhodophyticola porphyridii TaxID=1852017 RepID=A0A3L9Y5C2_9RHOB|nr:glycosyltransferase family 4 protein [Rhodophyticola porphyridii]RMA42257.1 glycosyltransferase family 1 protein [Rhodophyticola porphyridii]
MTPRAAAFAIPGDIATVTGGYIYERRLLQELRALGHDVTHLQLGASFPEPTPADMDHAVTSLRSLDPERALILDGLVYGAVDTAGLAQVRAPIVAMIHHPLALETGLDPALRDHLFRTERANLALAEEVLVPSGHTAHILTTQYAVPAQRITIAQPGSERPTGIRVPADPPLILSVGIQHPRKGHDVLLRALAGLRDLRWRAVIVGSAHDAACAEDLARLLDQLALGDRVTFAGRIPQPDLDALFGQASLFALATRYEGYGMVFDEALAWGLPIVSCDTGAVPHTVPSGAGLLVPPDAPEDLADAIACILTDKTLREDMEACAKRAGTARPKWQDTARIAGQVLNALKPRR